MSFMSIRGKANHCYACGKAVNIEYKDGAQLTQVGDEYVRMQQILNEKYNSEDYSAEKEGFYFHIEGLICDDCFTERYRIAGDKNILQEKNPVDNIGEVIDSYVDELDSLIDDILPTILDSIELKDLKPLSEEEFDETTDSIEEFIEDNEEEINEYILDRLSQHNDVSDLNRRFNDDLNTMKDDLLQLHDHAKEGFFREHQVNEVDYLNPVVVTDNTTRYPEENTIDYKFFSGPFELNLTQIKQVTEDANLLDFLDESDTDFGYEIEQLKERLSEK